MTSRTAQMRSRPRVNPGYEQSLLDLRDRLEHLWRQQVDEVTELTIRLHDTRAALGHVPANDARVTADLMMIEAQLDAARLELAEYDAALARFAKGAYGFCGHCGESVAADRLASSPSGPLVHLLSVLVVAHMTGG